MASTDPALEWANQVVLTVLQALLGMVSEPLKGVAVEIDGNTVTLHFAVSELHPTMEDDIQDIVGDVEGLLWPLTPEVKSAIFVGSAREGWPGFEHRMVLLAKT